MTNELKMLTLRMHDNWSRYRDGRMALVGEAEATIRADMLAVKNALGLAGLKARFYFLPDREDDCASLETRETTDSEWDNWDELGYAGKDKDGQLEALEKRLREIAPYVEWDKEIIV